MAWSNDARAAALRARQLHMKGAHGLGARNIGITSKATAIKGAKNRVIAKALKTGKGFPRGSRVYGFIGHGNAAAHNISIRAARMYRRR